MTVFNSSLSVMVVMVVMVVSGPGLGMGVWGCLCGALIPHVFRVHFARDIWGHLLSTGDICCQLGTFHMWC